ncbi:enoyl-CoA hydratase [uncultured Paracoccus sp.]|uniref:enoyl-CoA hydratase n=1 Tax=uncultured Paracoccus sp. TaxID=189685 RepID=UPI002601B881|nr:enoyl-CoA hydratase [uncultured Paracoccus sp.]
MSDAGRTTGSRDTAAPQGDVTLRIEGPVAHVTFDRPAARNAMTFAMYARLGEICDELERRDDLRAIVFRGAGGAFVAGTDISEFTQFSGGEDGVAYEARIDATLTRLTRLPAPTLAVIDGAAVGGGLAISAACDLRIVTPRARFGVPIARTVGNTLSAVNIARLIRALGDGPVRQMLLLSVLLDGETVHRLGFASACVAEDELESEAARQISRLCEAAPLTIRACRELLLRLSDIAPDDTDVIAQVYASRDFREGVTAFTEKRKPEWQGA